MQNAIPMSPKVVVFGVGPGGEDTAHISLSALFIIRYGMNWRASESGSGGITATGFLYSLDCRYGRY